MCGPPEGHGGGVLRLGGALLCPRGGDRRWRPLAPGPSGSHAAGRPGRVGSRHPLMRSSDASEGAGEAFAAAVPTPPPPEEAPGSTDVGTVGAGLRAASSG